MTKAEIRAEMRRRRRKIAPDVRQMVSERICAKLLAEVQSQRTIAVYWASPDEIDLTSFIVACMDRGIRIAAPRWNGEMYELAELRGVAMSDLVPGPHAILEPLRTALRIGEGEVDVWIVPGLAFARNGTRLGYGGGWYDRMMSRARSHARKIGVGYPFQLVDSLPCEPHDICLDAFLTAE